MPLNPYLCIQFLRIKISKPNSYEKALLFLAALSVSVAFASDNLRVPNIKSLSMGGSGVVLDALSNPSMMEWAKDRSVGIEYF